MLPANMRLLHRSATGQAVSRPHIDEASKGDSRSPAENDPGEEGEDVDDDLLGVLHVAAQRIPDHGP